MRILHVATLVTPDGAYGGPVRVAINQCRALAEMGHDVVLAAGSWGFAEPPSDLDGVPVKLFGARLLARRAGFASVVSPSLVRWLRRSADDFDVIHIHLARDLVTLPAAEIALRRRPTVFQTHGMIDPSDRWLAKPLDLMFTKRMLRAAASVLYLTSLERDQLQEVTGHSLANLQDLPNGVPPAPAQGSGTTRVGVLYLARLAPRKRPLAFVQAAARLSVDHPETPFELVGPDEGEGARVSRAITDLGRSNITWSGPISPSDVAGRIQQAVAYVLPAVDEPFPMSVLEAMAAGTPVIVTDSCGLAQAVEASGAGIVVPEDDPNALVKAIAEFLDDPALALRMGTSGRRAVGEHFSMSAISHRLDAVYQRALDCELAR